MEIAGYCACIVISLALTFCLVKYAVAKTKEFATEFGKAAGMFERNR